MKVTTDPGFRFGWQGTEIDYVVKAKGATDLRLPENGLPGVEARIIEVNKTADGVEGRVRVDVRDATFV